MISETSLGQRSRSESVENTDRRPLKMQASFQVKAVKAINFDLEKQAAFENQLLRAVISAGWSFNSIEDPEVKKLFRDFVPGARLPTQQRLSGTILDQEVIRIEGSFRVSEPDVYATLQCDGWKDISRQHLVAFMFTAKGDVRFHLTVYTFFRGVFKPCAGSHDPRFQHDGRAEDRGKPIGEDQ